MMSFTAKSQFVSYNASEGKSAAKKVADTTITSAQLIGILTLGDTTSAISLPLDVTFFDYTNGTSQGWLYLYRGKVKGKTTDTIISIGVVAIGSSQFKFFQALPVGLGLPIFDTFFAKDSVMPTKFTDSDAMMKNIRANADYKMFIANEPNSKSAVVPIRFSPSSIFFPSNTLVWGLTFFDQKNPNSTLLCEVNGRTGETKCQSFTGVEEQTQVSSFTITPNPAKNQATLTIPNELFAPNVSVELFNALGTSLQRFSVSINITEKITIPLGGLADGVYFVRYTANGRNYTKSLVIQN